MNRHHRLTPEERRKGGVQAYGLLLMERPGIAWWVLNTRIRPQARARRDADLVQAIHQTRPVEPDDIPY